MLAALRTSLARVSHSASAAAFPQIARAKPAPLTLRLLTTGATPPETPKPTNRGFGRLIASLAFVGIVVPLSGAAAYAHIPAFSATVNNSVPPAYVDWLQDKVLLFQGIIHKQAEPLSPPKESQSRLLDSDVPAVSDARPGVDDEKNDVVTETENQLQPSSTSDSSGEAGSVSLESYVQVDSAELPVIETIPEVQEEQRENTIQPVESNVAVAEDVANQHSDTQKEDYAPSTSTVIQPAETNPPMENPSDMELALGISLLGDEAIPATATGEIVVEDIQQSVELDAEKESKTDADDKESIFHKRVEAELSNRLSVEIARIEAEYKGKMDEQYEEAKKIIKSRDEKWKNYVQEKLQWQETNLSRVWQNRLEQEISYVQERFASEASNRQEKEKGIEDRVQQLGHLLDQRISFAQDITRVHSLWVALFSIHRALHNPHVTPFHHELDVMLDISKSVVSKEQDTLVDVAVESLRPLADGVMNLKSLQVIYKEMREDLYRYAIHPDVPNAPAPSSSPSNPVDSEHTRTYNMLLGYGSGGVFAHLLSHVANYFLIIPSIDNAKLIVEATPDSKLHPHQRLQSAEYLLFHENNLHAAVQEFEKLPRLTQERMQPWIVQAHRRLLADQSYVLLQCHISALAMGLL